MTATPDARPTPPPAERAPSTLGPWIAGWALTSVASVTAFELEVPRVAGKLGLRVVGHVDTLLLSLALGLVAVAVTDAGRRWVRPPWVRLGATLLAGAAFGGRVVEEDMRGLADAIPGPAAVWSVLLGAVVGCAAASGFFLGGLASRRPWSRVAAIVGAFVVALGHHRALRSGYEGIHLSATLGCASLVAGALDHSVVARWLAAPPRRHAIVAASVAVLGAVGVALDPGSDVVVLARRLPGHAVPGFAARVRQQLRRSQQAATGKSPWLEAREGLPSVAPTIPAVLPEDPVIVMLVVDTMRADLIDGPEGKRFENFQRLAASSTYFRRARSTAPHTTPAIASLVTGKYYSQLIWTYRERKRPRPYTDQSPTIGEELTKAGWASTGFVCLKQLTEDTGLTRGFTEPAEFIKPAKQITKAAVERLKKGSNGGLFIYTHMGELHAPYQGAGDTDHERYLSELEAVDHALGPLLDAVLEGPLAKRAALIVTADHGEAFGEHGTTEHGATVYEELLRIPMYIHLPGQKGAVSDAPVSLIDLGPTILDLAGAPTPATFMGQTLVPLLTGHDAELTRPLLAESGRSMRAYVVDDRWKYIHDVRRGTFELYDLQSDPTESENLFGTEAGRAKKMSAFTDKFFRVHGYKAKDYEVPYIP